LRPQDLGLLASIGASQLALVRRPRARIVITGNELVPPGAPPKGHRIVDANSLMLESLVARDGGRPLRRGIVPDEPEAILQAMREDADIVLVSGGSSVGQEDHAPRLVAQHGRLLFHGVAMRPSSPAGIGVLGGRLVFLLPGNPVSCLCAYDFFAGRAIRRLAGLRPEWPYVNRTVRLAQKLVSAVGRTDYARVRLEGDRAMPLGVSGASILSSTSRADAFVVIPEDSEGYPAGSGVDAWLYDF
jgi:molybdopterin molybdotransferase